MKNCIIILIASLVLFSGCDEDFFDQVVEMEVPEHEPALAVTSNLSNKDTIIWTYVTTSVGVLVQENPAEVNDATVEIYKNGTLLQTLPYIEQGLYGWQLQEPLGNDVAEYELKVAKSGFESVLSIQTMPEQIDIITATYEKDGAIDGDGERVDEVTVEFKDPGDINNFYKVDARLEYTGDDGILYNNNIYFFANDPTITETNNGLYFSDNIFNGDTYELKVLIYNLYIGDFMNDPKISINLVNVSDARYYRETSVVAYENSEDNPFAEPAVIFNNIENGHGIFSLEAAGPSFLIEL